MSPEQLRTLLAVVDEGSFDAAAARLHVTPSAVSQRVKALEQAVGQVLVRRTSPTLPTPAGKMLVRHARQVRLLEADLAQELGGLGRSGGVLSLPLAVNADSLATWFLPALTRFGARGDVVFDVRRADQALTVDLLRQGDVVAAVTSVAEPVQGARSTPLGVMRYVAVCSPAYAEAHLGGRAEVDRIAGAPIVDFDRTDRLQQRAYRDAVGRAAAARHFVPTSADFARAIVGGLGWGLLPVQQCATELGDGSLLRLAGARDVEVALYWQRWALGSALLEELTEAVVAAARAGLEG